MISNDIDNFKATSHRSSQQNDIYRHCRHDLQFIFSNPLTRHTCNRFSFWKHIDFNFRNRCQVNSEQSENLKQNMKTKSLNLSFQVQFKFIFQAVKGVSSRRQIHRRDLCKKMISEKFYGKLERCLFNLYNCQHSAHTHTHTLHQHDIV